MKTNLCASGRSATACDRRSFLGFVGAGAILSLGGQGAFCADSLSGPTANFGIPADKKLKAEWVQALFERGVPEVYRKDQLRNVAMPISGICAGQELNLSGEGALVGWRLHHCAIDIAQGFTLRTTVSSIRGRL